MVNKTTLTMAGEPDRRQFIKGIAATPAVAILAGCAGISGPSDESESNLEDIEIGDSTDHAGAFRFGDRYAMEVVDTVAEEVMLSGRFHEENRVLKYTDGEEEVESYIVDGQGYVITGDECIKYQELARGSKSISNIAQGHPDAPRGRPKLTVTDRTEMEGREIIVLQQAGAESGGQNTTATYYVDAETRYLKRIETGDTIVKYSSWDEVSPIEPPAMECRQKPAG